MEETSKPDALKALVSFETGESARSNQEFEVNASCADLVTKM